VLGHQAITKVLSNKKAADTCGFFIPIVIHYCNEYAIDLIELYSQSFGVVFDGFG
jgi:hypothetical protein